MFIIYFITLSTKKGLRASDTFSNCSVYYEFMLRKISVMSLGNLEMKNELALKLHRILNKTLESKLLLVCCSQLINSDQIVHKEEINYLNWLATSLGFDSKAQDKILFTPDTTSGNNKWQVEIENQIQKLPKEKAFEFISSFMALASIDGNVCNAELNYIDNFAELAGVQYDKDLHQISTAVFIETYKVRLKENGANKLHSISASAAAEIISRSYSEARHYMQFGGSEIITETVNRFISMDNDKSKGYIAEAVAVANKNISEMLSKTGNTWKLDSASNSKGGIGTEDIQKYDGNGNHIIGFELKFGSSGKESLDMYLEKGYSEDLMVPDDQLEEARQRLIEINEGLTRHRDGDIKVNATGLKPSDIQGMGVTSEEILAFQKSPALVSAKVADKLHAVELKNSIATGALTGAAFSGGISAIKNMKAVYDSEKTISEASKDIAWNTSKGAIKQAVIAGASKKIAYEAGRQGFKSLAKGNVATAIVVGGIETGGVLVDYTKGDIGGEEALKATGKVASTGTGAFAGAEVGALIGTTILPGPGTVVGGVIGGVVGSIGADVLYEKAGESIADKQWDFAVDPFETTVKTTGKTAAGALTGATIGSFVPVVGTAVGAVVGGVLATIFA